MSLVPDAILFFFFFFFSVCHLWKNGVRELTPVLGPRPRSLQQDSLYCTKAKRMVVSSTEHTRGSAHFVLSEDLMMSQYCLLKETHYFGCVLLSNKLPPKLVA